MITVLKLSSGEEIIGDLTITESHFSVKEPCILQMVPSRSNPEQPSMALFPYAFYVKNHVINIDADHIVWTSEPVQEVYNQYNMLFGSGIVVADKSNIVDFRKK